MVCNSDLTAERLRQEDQGFKASFDSKSVGDQPGLHTILSKQSKEKQS